MMTDILLWIIVVELTLALVVGGYILYEIQTTLAIIVLRECGGEQPEPTELAPLAPEILEAEDTSRTRDDATDTIGTFTGASWR